MADTKLTALTGFTPVASDIIYGVDDPGGTPASGKVTFTQVATLMDSLLPGQQHLYVPASAMIPRTTSGAAPAVTELATNDVMVETLNFDTAADEFAQFSLQMPKNWNEGTLIAQFIWSHPSTATNFGVAWAIQAVAFADDDALDTAFGTAVLVTNTGGTPDDLYVTAETSAMTVAGTPAAEEYVVFQVYRDVSDAGDNLAVDARLHGVKIHWTADSLKAD